MKRTAPIVSSCARSRFGVRGFSYIEVLISLFIASIMLTVFHTVVSVGPANAYEDHRSEALTIARAELESLRTLPVESLPESGPRDFVGLSILPFGRAEVVVNEQEAGVYDVSVLVAWRESTGDEEFSVMLTTLVADIP